MNHKWLKNQGFKKLKIKHKSIFNEHIKSTRYFTGLWASNFTYMWSLSQLTNINIYWKIVDDMLIPFIITKKNFMFIWCLPFGDGKAEKVVEATRKGLLLCEQWNRQHQHLKKPYVNLLNERQIQFISNYKSFRKIFSFKQLSSREIIWSIPKIKELKGKEFSEIRSLRNKIKRNHPTITFRRYVPEDYQEVLKVKKLWNKTSGKKYKTITDNNLFHQILEHYEALDELIFVATIEDEVVGFVTGSILPNGLSWGCISKALPEYKGLSEFLYTEFVKAIHQMDTNVQILHVGSDNNQEGLRRFKEKFRPVEILDLYALRLR